jgi:hypothetical protein
LLLVHGSRGDGRQAVVEIGLIVSPVRYTLPDKLAANVAQLLGRGNGQHDKVRRIVFTGNQSVAGRFDRCMDRLGCTMAGGREIGSNQDVDAADLGDGSHEKLRRESNPHYLG